MLKQLSYFNIDGKNKNTIFYDDIHYHMEEFFFEPGSDLVTPGEACTQIIFIVKGTV